MRRRIALAFTTVALACAHAPLPRNLAADPPLVVLPMERCGSAILLSLKIGGQGPLTFVLDTGADVSVISEQTQKKLGLSSAGTARISGVGGNREVSVVEVPPVSARGFQLTRRSMRWTVNRLFDQERSSGRHLDGLLGMDVLGAFQLFFDNSQDRIELRAPGAVGPLHGIGVELPVTGLPRRINVDGRLQNGSEAANRTWNLDTGFSAHLVLPGGESPANGARIYSSAGVSGKESMRWGHVQALQLGALQLSSVPAVWSTTLAFDQVGGLIGNEILSQFDWQIDPLAKRLWFVPNQRYSEPDTETWIGARLSAAGADFDWWVFSDVAPDGPAGMAGIEPNDVLLAVDGHPAQWLPVSELRRRLCPKGERVIVQILRPQGHTSTPRYVQFEPRPSE